MHLVGSVTQLSRQDNNFGDDQLGDRAGVGEGRVEDRNTLLGRELKVNLVGTDTETADGNKVLRLLENASSKLRLGTNTNDGDITTSRMAVSICL